MKKIVLILFAAGCIYLQKSWNVAATRKRDAQIRFVIATEQAWIRNHDLEISGEFGQKARDYGLKWKAIRVERVKHLEKQLSTYQDPEAGILAKITGFLSN